MPAEVDLFYVGGGQDREQALVAPRPRREGRRRCTRRSRPASAFLAVCGGYQLLGRFYRDRAGAELPGIGLLPLHTVAGERRMIGDVLLDCAWAGETLAGFENHAGRTILDEGAEPLGRVIAGFGNDGASGYEGCRAGPRLRHVPPRPAAPAQPVARRPPARRRARARDRRRGRAGAARRRARDRRARGLGRSARATAAAATRGPANNSVG